MSCPHCAQPVMICPLATECAHGGLVHVETGAHYCHPEAQAGSAMAGMPATGLDPRRS